MAKSKPRVKAPKKAAKGDIVTIKTLISHKMETGLRKDKKTGKIIPQRIINRFVAQFNGKDIFSVDLDPSISANPYFQFKMKVEESGEFAFMWMDDSGDTHTKTSKLKVS